MLALPRNSSKAAKARRVIVLWMAKKNGTQMGPALCIAVLGNPVYSGVMA